MKQAVGFDLDNTLYDHAQYVSGAYQDIAQAVEQICDVPRKEFFELIFENWQKLTSSCNHIFSDALRYYQKYTPELERRLLEIYRAHIPVLTPYPYVAEGLLRLKNAGYAIGLLSDGQPAVQRRKVKALGLEEFFDVIIVSGDFGPNYYKPHAKGFLELLSRLQTDPASAIYVGDNPFTDFETPKKLGMATIRILGGEYKNFVHNPEFVNRAFKVFSEAIDWCVARNSSSHNYGATRSL